MLALVLALGAVACGDDDDDEGEGEDKVTGVQALPASACKEVEFGGEGEPSAAQMEKVRTWSGRC